jgi:NAD(P)-dependent dehydrogenase (short-subunit alcohol dehydrogenase family)
MAAEFHFAAASKHHALRLVLDVLALEQPQDIAPAVVFLASADSSWITGETLFITGGLR